MNNKLITPILSIVGLLAIVVAYLVGAHSASNIAVKPPARPVGGQYNSNGGTVPNLTVTGLVKSNGITRFQKLISFESGSNYKFFTNKTNATLWITNADVTTNGTTTASGVSLYLIATTSDSINQKENFTAPTTLLANRIIYQAYMATSSTATTTSTRQEAQQNTNGGTKSAGLTPVWIGSSVLLWAQNASIAAGSPLSTCNDNGCNAATSSSLGLGTVNAVIEGYSTTTEDFNQYQY